MYKLIATLSNHPSPLEKFVFDSPKTVELLFEYPPTTEEILNKLEPIVVKLRGNKKAMMSMEVVKESGEKVLVGTVDEKDRFHGTVMS